MEPASHLTAEIAKKQAMLDIQKAKSERIKEMSESGWEIFKIQPIQGSRIFTDTIIWWRRSVD